MKRTAKVSALGMEHLALQGRMTLVTVILVALLMGTDALADNQADTDDAVRYAVVVEEIVVVGERDGDKPNTYERLLTDPLRERIIKEIRQLEILKEEFEWRQESALLTIRPPRFRWGYDPRDADRSDTLVTTAALPLDLVSPAPVLRIDF